MTYTCRRPSPLPARPSTSPPVSRRHPRSRVHHLPPGRPPNLLASLFSCYPPGCRHLRSPPHLGRPPPPRPSVAGRGDPPPPNAAKTSHRSTPGTLRLPPPTIDPSGKPATPHLGLPEMTRAPTSTHHYPAPAPAPYRSSSSHPVAPRQTPTCRAPYPHDLIAQCSHSILQSPSSPTPAPPPSYPGVNHQTRPLTRLTPLFPRARLTLRVNQNLHPGPCTAPTHPARVVSDLAPRSGQSPPRYPHALFLCARRPWACLPNTSSPRILCP